MKTDLDKDSKAENTTMSEHDRRPLPSKLYFRIGEVAELVGVEPHVLRYWEREFRTIRPTKSAKGQRVYSRKDVESLQRVRELLYAEGFTIAGAKKKLLRGASTAVETVDATDVASEASAAAPTSRLAPAPARGPRGATSPVRSKLVALRREVEAFLEELGGT
ncbi:MAG: MerR family transcriptional regulator [Polyangiaceae bacterium]